MTTNARQTNRIEPALARKLQALASTAASEPALSQQHRLSHQDLADALEAGMIVRNRHGDYELTRRAQDLIATTGGRRTNASSTRRPAAETEAMPSRIIRRRDELPLDWLFKHRDKSGRRWITEAQYEAGCRIAADFHAASMAPQVTMRWQPDPAARSGRTNRLHVPLEHSERAVAAAARTRAALAAVGPELAGVLIDVCCYEKGLEIAEKEASWPARSAKVVLTLALEALARHYGLTSGPRRGPGILHWGTDDYRPAIDPDGP